jgi:hypothetical protein
VITNNGKRFVHLGKIADIDFQLILQVHLRPGCAPASVRTGWLAVLRNATIDYFDFELTVNCFVKNNLWLPSGNQSRYLRAARGSVMAFVL